MEQVLEHNTKQVNIGVHPSRLCLIHHIEVITAVPYRYTKVYSSVKGNDVVNEPFYM